MNLGNRVERTASGTNAAILGLVVMMTWTVVIKYLVPLVWAASERASGRAVAAPILWDFWPLAHLALVILLARGHRWAWGYGLAVGLVETTIVVSKLTAFALAPQREFMKLLWFTNKLYVLAFFVVFLVWLTVGSGRALRSRR